MDIATQAPPTSPPTVEPNRRTTHEDRRIRRKEMADFVQNLYETKPEATNAEIHAETARHFKVCIATIHVALVEHGIKRTRRWSDARTEKIKTVLRMTEKNLTEIANEVSVSKQRVHQVYAQLVRDGEQIPSRERGLARSKRAFECETKLIETFRATKSVYKARVAAKISRPQALKLLREAGLVESRYVKPDGSPRVTRTMMIIGAMFDDSLTFSDIARKFKIPAPCVFNIAQAATYAGVPIPIRRDGTTSVFGTYLSALLIRRMSRSVNPVLLTECRDSVNHSLRSLPSVVEIPEIRLNPMIKAQVFRFIRDGLATSAYCRHLKARSFALTEKGRHDAELLSDQVMSDLRSNLIAQFSGNSSSPTSESSSVSSNQLTSG